MASNSDKQREAWARWANVPPGLPPELASKFMLGLHGGKTIKQMVNTGEHYICALSRFKKHCELNPEWGAEAHRLGKINHDRRRAAGNWNRAKTHCARGHDLSVHGKVVIQRGIYKWRRCKLCTSEYQKGSGIIRAEAVEKAKEALRAGVRISTILNSIIRPPTYNLLRKADPTFDRLIRATKPLRAPARKVQVISRRIKGPTLTGIIAAQPDPIFDAVSRAVGLRHERDIRMEAISLTTLDYLEGRIGLDGIPAAARRHLSSLYNARLYTRSLDEPRYRSGATPWIETMSESAGMWASS